VRTIIWLGAVVAALTGIDDTGIAERQHPYVAAASVCIELSLHDDLSGPAFTTMRSEASRIWLRHGVELTWTSPTPTKCDTVVPVVFDEVTVRALAGPRREALALTEFSGPSRRIYVSASRAFNMVGQIHGRSSPQETIGERDYRQGTLIGRALAHELGHVLLNTTAHSPSGLMRAVFNAKDALSTDQRMTDLTPAETQTLSARFSLVPAGGPHETPALAQRAR
jgi:hypothetical protein